MSLQPISIQRNHALSGRTLRRRLDKHQPGPFSIQRIATCLGLAMAIGLGAPLSSVVLAQPKFEANYDESKVPRYQLPEITDAATAEAKDFPAAWSGRRAELLQVFAEQMFGTPPSNPYELKFDQTDSGLSLAGKALRQQWRVTVSTEHGNLPIDLLVFTPANAKQSVPCFLGLNFGGNHTVALDEEITVTTSWVRQNDANATDVHRATAEGRGSAASRWPVEQIIDAGMGVATAYYGDIDPDTDDEFQNGIHALFPEHRPSAEAPNRWGSIAAWSWGLSRLLDCIEAKLPQIDASRVAVIGHSRLGKTALWAGATDSRFAAVISNNSGCGGAALSRRAVGETVGRINDSFPHWFCENFKQYNLNENQLPIDQHQLLALVAPRLLYVASATGDQWADPHGEFISLHLAADIHRRFPDKLDPKTNLPVKRVGYHLRDGKHDINAWDWAHYIRFVGQL